MALKASLFFICGAALFVLISSAVYVHCKPTLEETIRTDNRFREAWKFAQKSDIIKDFNRSDYSADLTLFIPSNSAWKRVSKERAKYLLKKSNREDLEMLLLYCGAELLYAKKDFKNNEITTFVGLPVYVSPADNEVCLLTLDGEKYQCANVVQWDVRAADGIVHIIDDILYPHELEEKFEAMGI